MSIHPRALSALITRRGLVALVAGMLALAIPIGGGTVLAAEATAEEPTKQLAIRSDDVSLDVGEQRTIAIFRCDRTADGSGARVGRDGRAGTRDDRCRPERFAQLVGGPPITLTPSPDDASSVRVEGVASGWTTIRAMAVGVVDGVGVVSVFEQVADDDHGAIGTRPRGSGDMDGDGILTNADVDLLTSLLSADPRGFVTSDDSSIGVEANILGREIVSGLDVVALESRLTQAKRRRRAASRNRVNLTPSDIVPLEAGGFGVIGAILDSSGLGKLDGAFRVAIAGPARLYFQGEGSWGIAGEVFGEIVLEQAGVIVFTAPDPGIGFVGHQVSDSQFAETALFEAVAPGDPLALPAPGPRLSVPYDVDFDGQLDWSDYIRVASALGMIAGDSGFPSAGDADGDGFITQTDADLIAPVIVLAGTVAMGGDPGSGDFDGDGDVDRLDARAAASHLFVEFEFNEVLLSLPSADSLLARLEAFLDPAVGDVNGDGVFDGLDVVDIGEAAGIEPSDLGPHYDFEPPTAG